MKPLHFFTSTRPLLFLSFLSVLLRFAPAAAEAPEPSKSAGADKLPQSVAALAWLEGCWRGAVNQREFREHWLPLGGGMMVGAGQTVMQDKTQDYEYLRLEARHDGVYYVALPSGNRESAFKLATVAADERNTVFTFDNVVDEFPQHVVYVRAADGWLFASIEGKLNGEVRKVTYPMRRVGCESGELIRK
jgi:hypothetical protein